MRSSCSPVADFRKNTQFFCAYLLTNRRFFSTIFLYTETYRSGHNGHDSKTNALFGSSPLKNLDFIKKTNRLQDVKFEISYVNMCGVSYGERRIFATKLVIFA